MEIWPNPLRYCFPYHIHFCYAWFLALIFIVILYIHFLLLSIYLSGLQFVVLIVVWLTVNGATEKFVLYGRPSLFSSRSVIGGWQLISNPTFHFYVNYHGVFKFFQYRNVFLWLYSRPFLGCLCNFSTVL